VSDYRIEIPHRARDESVVDVLCDDLRAIEDPESRAVTRAVLQEAAENGTRTVGQVIDGLEAMSQSERREVLDRARVELGLDTVAETIAHQRFVDANEAARRRATRRRAPACPVCGRTPTGVGGMPAEVPVVKRWHCPDHEHLAAPGDMDPPQLPVDMLMRYVDPDEVEREQREDERRLAEHKRKLEERAAEAEAIRKARERWIEERRDDPYVNPFSGPGWSAPK
jgi:hypothetical protein